MLFISTCISGAINLAQLTIENNSFVFSIALSGFLAVSNLIWQKVCEWLTMLEGHYTWTAFRKHQTVKVYAWKTINISTIFFSRYLVRVYFQWLVTNVPFYGTFATQNTNLEYCSLEYDAETFLINVIMEFTVIRAASVMGPWLLYRFWAMCNVDKAGYYSDKGRPEFDVSTEYLELLYRQFVLYLAMSVCPLVAPLSFLGNLWEYPIDKWTLLNLARTPPILRGSMRSFLVFFMFITALNGLIMFPQGTAWVLAGFNYGQHCNNTIFKYNTLASSLANTLNQSGVPIVQG